MLINDTTLPPTNSSFVQGGFPSPAEHYIETPLDLNKLLVHRPDATYFVRIASDAMIKAGIQVGDILVVDRSLDAFHGAIVIVSVDNEFMVRYLCMKSNGAIRLDAANPASRSIFLEDLQEIRLFGVVTAIVRRFHYQKAGNVEVSSEARQGKAVTSIQCRKAADIMEDVRKRAPKRNKYTTKLEQDHDA